MASELPFEYTKRWPEVKALLDAGDMEGAKQALEIRDRDLEDFLKTVGGGGGTTQSILATSSATGDFGNSGNNSHLITCTFNIPSDASFSYWIDYTVKGYVIQPLESGKVANLYGYTQIREQSPGSGFDTQWGYGDSVYTGVDWVALGAGNEHGNPHLSGASRRIEQVDPSLLGTTVHVDHTMVYATNSGTYATVQYLKASTSALLFALPALVVL